MSWFLKLWNAIGIDFTQASTWKGAVFMATAAGISIKPEYATAIVTVGTAVAGAIGVFIKGKTETAQVTTNSGANITVAVK